MVQTELAQQILEDLWSSGQPLEEKRPEIATLWKQMQREDGKVRADRTRGACRPSARLAAPDLGICVSAGRV